MPVHSILLFVHVLGACIWFGGHVVLSFVILPQARRAQDAGPLLAFERSFEKLGMPALLAQAATGPYLALKIAPVADWFRWENSTQDHIASKLIFLGVIVLLAISMKLRVLPRLAAGEIEALRSAAWHVHSVTLISFLILIMGVSLHTGGFSY